MKGIYDSQVGDDEWLARYIIRSDHVRNDGTVKPAPFVPHKYTELSVTRHLALGETKIWEVGSEVARQRGTRLVGRADVQTEVYLKQKLKVIPDPVEGNPNHANVTGWPPEKPAQIAIALEVALRASYKKFPTDS